MLEQFKTGYVKSGQVMPGHVKSSWDRSILVKLGEVVSDRSSWKFLNPKHFWIRFFLAQNFLWPYNYFRTKFFVLKIVLDQKFFWTQ